MHKKDVIFKGCYQFKETKRNESFHRVVRGCSLTCLSGKQDDWGDLIEGLKDWNQFITFLLTIKERNYQFKTKIVNISVERNEKESTVSCKMATGTLLSLWQKHILGTWWVELSSVNSTPFVYHDIALIRNFKHFSYSYFLSYQKLWTSLEKFPKITFQFLSIMIELPQFSQKLRRIRKNVHKSK